MGSPERSKPMLGICEGNHVARHWRMQSQRYRLTATPDGETGELQVIPHPATQNREIKRYPEIGKKPAAPKIMFLHDSAAD
jgi:hypothetical protein